MISFPMLSTFFPFYSIGLSFVILFSYVSIFDSDGDDDDDDDDGATN